MNKKVIKNLITYAEKIALNAYSPYSNFRVGAALLCQNGEIFTGCNIENRSYGLTICAERVAIFKAISKGITDFSAIAISTPDGTNPLPPCGACRQVISEFSNDMQIFYSCKNGEIIQSDIKKLYPNDSLHELLN